MKRTLLLLLLTTSLSYGQSFFDVTIGGGVIKYNDIRFEGIDILTKNKLAPFGSLELRYSHPMIKKVYLSPSLKFDIDDIDYKIRPAFAIGTIFVPKEWLMLSIGGYNNGDNISAYLRTDTKLIDTDKGWIGLTTNLYDNKIMIGITFKDFLNKQYEL